MTLPPPSPHIGPSSVCLIPCGQLGRARDPRTDHRPRPATDLRSCPLGAISSSDPSKTGPPLASLEPTFQVSELDSDLSSFRLPSLESCLRSLAGPRSSSSGGVSWPLQGKEENPAEARADARAGVSAPAPSPALHHTSIAPIL